MGVRVGVAVDAQDVRTGLEEAHDVVVVAAVGADPGGVHDDVGAKGEDLLDVVRGQDATPAFEVAPDMTSYKFTKLDPTKEEDKEFVNDMWAWDKPVTVDGKTYDFADGKVFK